jgi:precorrin-6Y C5,15-methyltransferase (decarboxylating) CbiT subunit
MYSNFDKITTGIKDEYFTRGNIPMTKEEVRTVTISKLDLKVDDIIVDIGAGTGSLSIECGRLLKEGKVYAVEQKSEGINLIKENSKKFGVENITTIEAKAPEGLEGVSDFSKVIIGGSGGNLEEIFRWIDNNYSEEVKVVINTITIENTYKSIELLKSHNYEECEVTQIQCSKSKSISNLTMMLGQNPVYIISGLKR